MNPEKNEEHLPTHVSNSPSLTSKPASADLLVQDAEAIRGLMARGQQTMLEIAHRLKKIRAREGWSTRELAKWCGKAGLGLISQSRIDQLLHWADTIEILEEAQVVTASSTPNEWLLRPLTQAHTQGMSDDEVVRIWWEQMQGFQTLPSYNNMKTAVADSAFMMGLVALNQPKTPDGKHGGNRGVTTEEAFDLCNSALEKIEGLMTEIEGSVPWQALSTSDRKAYAKRWRHSAERFAASLENSQRPTRRFK